MPKLILIAMIPVIFAAVNLEAQSGSTSERDVASTIIAIERSALDRSDKGDVDGFLEISEPEVSYFDPSLDKPIHGLKALSDYYHKFTGLEQSAGVMSNANVQVSGDIAVLTFNYVTKTLTTQKVTKWNATEVYRRTSKGWRIIHTHWSFLKPQLAQGLKPQIKEM